MNMQLKKKFLMIDMKTRKMKELREEKKKEVENAKRSLLCVILNSQEQV